MKKNLKRRDNMGATRNARLGAFLRAGWARVGGRLRLVTCLGLGIVLLVSGGCSRQAVGPEVLAKVGSREITLQDFENEIQWRQRNGQSLPGKEALLEELVQREVSLQKARAAGLDKEFEVRRNFENTMIAALQQRELMPRLEALDVTEQELLAAYQEQASRYSRPAKARLALIQIKANDKMSEEKLETLKARILQAREAASALPDLKNGFSQVALNFSEDQASRYRGGDAGWFDEGQPAYNWPTDVVAKGWKLEVGELSPVIQAKDGFYLITKTDRREASVTAFEQVRPALERQWKQEKRLQTELDFKNELRRLVAVQIYPKGLTKAVYPTAAVAKAQATEPPALPRAP